MTEAEALAKARAILTGVVSEGDLDRAVDVVAEVYSTTARGVHMRDEAAVEAEIQAKGKTAPRITPSRIDELIAHEVFINAGQAALIYAPEFPRVGPLPPSAKSLECMTICLLVLKNGFIVTGESACVSPENYDEAIGQRIARENARQKIWALEGYALRSKLAEEA